MALPAPIGPKLLGDRIAVQHDLSDFLPICILGLGVEETEIGHEMPFVIAGDLVACRRYVIHIGLKFDRNPHRHSPSSWESSEERRVGKECVSTCRYRGSPEH